MKSRCEARLSEKLNKGCVVMDETMPEARHQMKDLRQRSTASGSSVISFDYRLDQLKKVIYFLAANDAYEAVPISRSVTVKYCPSTTLPLPTLGLDNKPYTADDVIDDDASCSAAAMAVSSSSSKRATSPRLSFEAKQTPSSIKTFETNVSDDVTNRLLATCLQPDDAVITVIITERTDAEEIEDEDDGRRSAADANGVRQPLLNNRISDVRGRLFIGLHLEKVFYLCFLLITDHRPEGPVSLLEKILLCHS